MADRVRPSRRQALKLALTAAGAGTAVLAGGGWPAPAPAVWAETPGAAPAAVPLPPLGVIALNRLAFGPRPGHLDYATFDGMAGATPAEKLASFVDWQLNLTAEGSECTTRLANAGLATLNLSLTQLWSTYGADGADRVRPVRDVRAATLIRALYSQRQLYELAVDFWHNHFNIYAWDYGYASLTWAHWDRTVIRAHALGNFRQMLGAVAAHPAMLFYLDNYLNQVAGFNENWARELCELHTLGAENYLGVRDPMTVPTLSFPGGGNFPAGTAVAEGYVDNDVYEIARAFTGWRVEDGWWPVAADTGNFLYYADWHDKANKFVLGRYFPNSQANDPQRDGNDALDLLAYHPGTARHVCRKLCRRFVGDDPSDALVNAAADVFIAERFQADQLRRVLRFILLSDDFQSTFGEKIKRPFEAAVGALRAVNADVRPELDGFYWHFDEIGQPLFEWRPPNGYPDTRAAWLSSVSLLKRWQFVNSAIEGWIDHWEAGVSTELVAIDVVAQSAGGGNTANQLVDFWISRVLGRPMANSQDRDRIVQFLRGPYSANAGLSTDHQAEYLPRAVALLLMAPDCQWR